MDDLISRKAVIDKAITIPIAKIVTEDKVIYRRIVFVEDIENLPPVQPEPKNKLISEIEGKTPEETYDFLVWLLNDYGMRFTDSRQAVIEWLRGEQNG